MKRNYVKISLVFALILVVALCFMLSACDLFNKQEHFKEEATYNFTSGSAVGMDISEYLDPENTYATFSKKGEMVLRITPTKELIELANIALAFSFESVFGENHDNIAGISLSDMERYTSEVLPGESFFSLMSAVIRLGDSLGLKIHGLNMDDEEVKAFFKQFEETHLIPEFVLPEDFYITIEAPYGLCEIHSATQDAPFKAIYLGDYKGVEDSDPYMLLTRYTTAENKEAVFLYNAILDLRIDFAVK